jgi:hypothetical protein
MTCMIASNSELFPSPVLTGVRRRTFSNEPASLPRSLFDFSNEATRRRRVDPSVCPEEDLERWDGLS